VNQKASSRAQAKLAQPSSGRRHGSCSIEALAQFGADVTCATSGDELIDSSPTMERLISS
jgi:hypothetical protein